MYMHVHVHVYTLHVSSASDTEGKESFKTEDEVLLDEVS